MTAIKSLNEIVQHMRDRDGDAVALVTKAYECAQRAHEGQKRFSGEPYFTHVAEVGYLLADAGMDSRSVAAGLLHDTIEDTGVVAETIEREFGNEILGLVDGVSKLGALRYRGMERHAESLRKLFAATAKDIRVLIIKLMDRLHNARTLEYVPIEKRARIAIETLEVYAPIADRLNMGLLKRELEDAAFPYAFPKEHKRVLELLKERRSETETRLGKTEKSLMRLLAEANLKEFHMESRMKGVYSLYKKLERKNWDITQINDILALRIIVRSVSDCYTTLGVVHGAWRPVPGKIKDYIAFPKPNGYQSLHTTIYTGDGGVLEIQIRTTAMHREAQFGIASHFSYKERSGYQSGVAGSSLEWIRQFIPAMRTQQKQTTAKAAESYAYQEAPQWVKDLAEAKADEGAENEYLERIKSDFFSYRVFVFTPENDVIDLPLNATPIDFAYAIHSDIGDHMFGAKVNGKLVALESILKNGDIVEIITKPSSKPNRKWLEIARTTMAKKHIRVALERADIAPKR